MVDVWGEVRAPQVYAASEQAVDWTARVLWLGVLFLLVRAVVEYFLTGIFYSVPALLLFILFLLIPYLTYLLRGNVGWGSVVDFLFVSFCTYLFFSLVVFLSILF